MFHYLTFKADCLVGRSHKYDILHREYSVIYSRLLSTLYSRNQLRQDVLIVSDKRVCYHTMISVVVDIAAHLIGMLRTRQIRQSNRVHHVYDAGDVH